jgi:hypothetical protein
MSLLNSAFTSSTPDHDGGHPAIRQQRSSMLGPCTSRQHGRHLSCDPHQLQCVSQALKDVSVNPDHSLHACSNKPTGGQRLAGTVKTDMTETVRTQMPELRKVLDATAVRRLATQS